MLNCLRMLPNSGTLAQPLEHLCRNLGLQPWVMFRTQSCLEPGSVDNTLIDLACPWHLTTQMTQTWKHSATMSLGAMF